MSVINDRQENIAVEDYGWESAESVCTAPYLYPKILDLLESTAAKRILDLGCGNGHLASVLSKQGYSVCGCDADTKGIAIAKNNYGNLADFQVLDVGDEPPDNYLNDKFDAIVSTEVVEHLFLPRKLYQFAHKALKKDGILIVSTPYHGYIKNVLISLLNHWDSHHQPTRDGWHIKFWSRNTLNELADDCGFQEKQFIGTGRFPYLWKSMIIVYEKK
jgi:2-polyprenyl-3-methyl-5-hydroxy-6-metoxy-1,4-benzoquinol methylase